MPQCQVCGPVPPVDREPEDPGGNHLREEDITCPTCGRELGPPVKAPWHFKLLVVSVVVYLGWRAWQGIEWVLGKL